MFRVVGLIKVKVIDGTLKTNKIVSQFINLTLNFWIKQFFFVK